MALCFQPVFRHSYWYVDQFSNTLSTPDAIIPILGGLLTALVLRYEYTISEPSIGLPVSEDSELAPSAELEDVLPTTASGHSLKEAIASRVAISSVHPRFPKPLFHILLAGIFAGHVPPIVLSALLVHRPALFDKVTHPVFSNTAKIIISHPRTTWTIMWLPFLMGIACLTREDGGALWKYHEVLAHPLAQSTVDPDVTGESAESLLQEAGLSKD